MVPRTGLTVTRDEKIVREGGLTATGDEKIAPEEGLTVRVSASGLFGLTPTGPGPEESACIGQSVRPDAKVCLMWTVLPHGR